MNNSPNIKQVETVLKYIKNELYSGRLQPGERLPAERRLADMLGVGRAHVRAAFQKLEFYGIVQTFPQSGTVVAQEKMQVLERMITDALQIRQYDFASLVYVRVLLEIEAIKLCARNRTAEDLENIERALEECEAKFYTEERVSKDFAYHQALARGAHNPVIASMLAGHHARRLALLPALPCLHGSAGGGLFRASRTAALRPREGRGGGRRDAAPPPQVVERIRCGLQRREPFSRIALLPSRTTNGCPRKDSRCCVWLRHVLPAEPVAQDFGCFHLPAADRSEQFASLLRE